MDSPLRIALINEHASPMAALAGTEAGGQNVYVAHIARALACAGHEVDLLTRRDSTRQAVAIDLRPGLRVLHIAAGPAHAIPKEELLPYMREFSHATLQLFRHSVRYDVVHANLFMSALVGLHLKAQLDVPLVVTFHELGLLRREHLGDDDSFPSQCVAIEQRVVREADRIVAGCPQDRNDLIRLYGARRERLAMVPCGVDPHAFAPGSKTQARRILGLRDDEFVALQIGRVVPHKGIDNIIRALAHMNRSRPVRLLVVGGNSADADERITPEITRLRGVALDCGVGGCVTFVGQRPHGALRDYCLAADVFVSTPWHEPFGITPLEAMACGTPVIGSTVGGICYSVVDGVTGYLVPPRDPRALAQRLELLRDNPALAAALGRAGVHRVRSHFTWDRVARELVDVYRAAALHRRALREAPIALVPRVPSDARRAAGAQRPEALA